MLFTTNWKFQQYFIGFIMIILIITCANETIGDFKMFILKQQLYVIFSTVNKFLSIWIGSVEKSEQVIRRVWIVTSTENRNPDMGPPYIYYCNVEPIIVTILTSLTPWNRSIIKIRFGPDTEQYFGGHIRHNIIYYTDYKLYLFVRYCHYNNI